MLSTSLWTSSLNPFTPKNNRAFRTPRRRRPRKRRKWFRVLWKEIAITPTHSLWQMKGEPSWSWISKNHIQVQREKRPGRKILAQGRPLKADHPRAICFLYSVQMQWVLLVPSARIFLAERFLHHPTKIQVLGTNQTEMAAGRSLAYHGNEGWPFRLALPRTDFCDKSAERWYLRSEKRAGGPKLHFCFLSPAKF